MKTAALTAFVAASLALRAHAYLDVEDGALNVRHFHMVERSEDGEIIGRAFRNTYDIVRRDEGGLEARGRCTTVLACGTAGGCATMAGQRYCKGESWEKSFQKAVSQTGANGITGLKMMAEGIGRGPVGTLVGAVKTTTKAILDAKKEQKKNAAAREAQAKKNQPKKSQPKKSPAKAPAKKSAPKQKKNTRTKAPAKKPQGKPAARKPAARKPAARKPAARKPAARSPAKKPAAKAQPPRRATTPKKAAPAPKKAAPAPKKAAAPAKNQKKKRDLEDFEEILNRRDFEVVERDEDMNLVERGEYSTFDLVTRNEDGEIVTRECEMYNGDVSCM